MSTLEEMFIDQYKTIEAELAFAKRRISELEEELSGKPVEELTETHMDSIPTAWRINEPIEIIELEMAESYNYDSGKKHLGMTPDEIRDAVSTREGIEALCSKEVGYGPHKLMKMHEIMCPLQIIVFGRVFGLMPIKGYYDDKVRVDVYAVEEDGEGLKERKYYRAEHKEAMYEWGLEKLKKRLLEYADKLDEEERDAD